MSTHPEQLLARAADGAALSGDERLELDRHLEGCAACREALEAQRVVSRVLAERPPTAAAAGFAARVAARLDREPGGFLDLVNWRAWTVGLAPVAAALMLAAYLGAGTWASPSASDTTVTFESWTAASAENSAATVFLQPSVTGDQLLETVLTGVPPATTGASDVR